MAMVRCWTVEVGIARQGIDLEQGPDGEYIRVGSPGRGRELTTVPIPPNAVIRPGEPGLRQSAQVMEADVRDCVAVILIRDHSGYRGTWHLGFFGDQICPKAEEPRDYYGECPACGRRYDHDVVPGGELMPEAIGRVIAKGYCAQGAAGRMGGGPEYLIAAKPGRFSIRRHGRLYDAPRTINVTVEEDGTVTTEDAMAAVRRKMAEAAW